MYLGHSVLNNIFAVLERAELIVKVSQRYNWEPYEMCLWLFLGPSPLVKIGHLSHESAT